MLHGCAFPGCSTFTLSTYCVEHELLVRAVKESERAQATDATLAADTALTADDRADRQRRPKRLLPKLDVGYGAPAGAGSLRRRAA